MDASWFREEMGGDYGNKPLVAYWGSTIAGGGVGRSRGHRTSLKIGRSFISLTKKTEREE